MSGLSSSISSSNLAAIAENCNSKHDTTDRSCNSLGDRLVMSETNRARSGANPQLPLKPDLATLEAVIAEYDRAAFDAEPAKHGGCRFYVTADAAALLAQRPALARHLVRTRATLLARFASNEMRVDFTAHERDGCLAIDAMMLDDDGHVISSETFMRAGDLQ